MLSRVPLALKATLLSGAVVSCVGVMQWLLLARLAGVSLTWGQRVVVSSPLAICVLVSGLYTAYLVRSKTAPLRGAFERIARGDFSERLPPAPDREFAVVERAFTALGTALEALTRELRHADAQRRRLFADLAHELATPTSSILGVSEALATPGIWTSAHERDRMLGALEHEAVRLERLIRDMRELAHLDDPDTQLAPEASDVAEVARRAAERVSVLSGRPVLCDAQPAPAIVDPLRIDQVMMNLLNNAVRHTPADGGITVSVSRISNERVCVIIEDSGPGVSDSVLPHLGERLLRVDPSRNRATGGHGLGLSIVSAIVERHGGTLRFERASLGGLRVAIELPTQSPGARVLLVRD